MNEHGVLLQIENLEVDNIIVGAKVSLIFPLKSNVHEKLS